MSIQTVVGDIKSRITSLTTQGQDLVKTLPDKFKQARPIVVEQFDVLVKTETASAKDIYASSKAGFDKAKVDGIKAVLAKPIEYLPPKGKFYSVFNDTVDIFSKTGDELYKVLKGAPTIVEGVIEEGAAAAKKAKKVVKKAAAAAKKAVDTVDEEKTEE